MIMLFAMVFEMKDATVYRGTIGLFLILNRHMVVVSVHDKGFLMEKQRKRTVLCVFSL